MWKGAAEEGWGSMKIFTCEQLEGNGKGSTHCGFCFLCKEVRGEEWNAKNEELGVEYLREMEKAEIVTKMRVSKKTLCDTHLPL